MTRDEALQNRPTLNSIRESDSIDEFIAEIYDEFETDRREQVKARGVSRKETRVRLDNEHKAKMEAMKHKYETDHKNLLNETKKLREELSQNGATNDEVPHSET